MDNNQNNTLAATALAVSAVIIISVTYGLVRTFDVPWQIGVKSAFPVFLWVCGFIGIIIGCFKLEWLTLIIPLYISLIIPVLSPILRHVAGVREDFPFQPEIAWYGTGWGLFLIFALINCIGYGFLYWWKKRDSYDY
jgi:hypothetical protein